MLDYDFDESIGHWLTTATQTYHRAFTEQIAPFGITDRQSQVLGWLALENEMSQTELAAKMMIEPPTLAGILDRMERRGWIVRRTCREDRRRKWIGATSQAEPVWAKIVECGKQIRARATQGLTDQEITLLRTLLDRIRENVAADQTADTLTPTKSTGC